MGRKFPLDALTRFVQNTSIFKLTGGNRDRDYENHPRLIGDQLLSIAAEHQVGRRMCRDLVRNVVRNLRDHWDDDEEKAR